MLKNESDTIVAISTRAGESAIGIVRMSGIDSIKIADDIFFARSGKKISITKTYTMVYGYIKDTEGKVIDDVIVSVMKSPRSYTTEDVVEINCHGGIIATNKVMEMCISKGARVAEPGEFTKRAFLNGRIDLTQAESVIETINSKTETSLRIAAKNARGLIGSEIKRIRKKILDVLVELEASIDFIEEDLEITPYEKIKVIVKRIDDEIRELIKYEEKGKILKNGLKIAIIGKPNVGKSSLLNILSKKEKAIVTDIPGTTRDAVEEVMLIKGIPVIMIDTAGIRKTIDKIEKIGVKKTLGHIKEAEIVIFMLDWSRKIDDDDKKIMKLLKERDHIICINKIDLGKNIDMDFLEKKDPGNVMEISVLKNKGINTLEDKIKDIALGEKSGIEDRIIVNARQKEILLETSEQIKSALKAMDNKLSEEFPASDLNIAYETLGQIIGESVSEDVLNGIFSKFCIGK